MIKISQKQLDALKSGEADKFHARLCDFIVKKFNVQDARRPALDRGMTSAIADAHNFNLKSEKAIATYGVATFLIGLRIKNDPKVNAAMSSTTLSETNKIAWLNDWLAALEAALETPADG